MDSVLMNLAILIFVLLWVVITYAFPFAAGIFVATLYFSKIGFLGYTPVFSGFDGFYALLVVTAIGLFLDITFWKFDLREFPKK